MQLSIANRLNLLIFSAIFALLAVGLAGALSVKSIDAALRNVTEDSLPSIQTLGQMQLHFMQIRVGVYQHMQNTDAERYALIDQRIDTAKQALQKDFAAYEKLVSNDADRALLKTDHELFSKYQETLSPVLNHSRTGNKEEALSRTANELVPASEMFVKATDAHTAFNDEQASTAKGLCCTNPLQVEFPLPPDGFMPRAPSQVFRAG